MKSALLSTAFSLACFFAGATAEVSLGAFPDVVNVGETYTLSWTATVNYVSVEKPS
jgi:hypothetical protein